MRINTFWSRLGGDEDRQRAASGEIRAIGFQIRRYMVRDTEEGRERRYSQGWLEGNDAKLAER
jgi:hypothetical protein